MNQSSSSASAPGASLLPDGTGIITTAHLVMIVLVAILAIAIIVVGMRRSAKRHQAQREVVAHAREAGVEHGSDRSHSLDDELADPEPARQSQSQRQTETRATPVPPAPSPTPAPSPAMSEPTPLSDEPIVAGSTLDANPGAIAADAPTGAENGPADGPVTQLKGLGPKVAARLDELGITTVGQIAALDEDRAAALDAELGTFSGRMARDRWVEQARFLAAGDRAGFESVFGRL